MKIVFRCPACRKGLRAPERAVGKHFRCPACGAKARIARPAAETLAAETAPSAVPAWQKHRVPLLAGAAAALVLVIGGGVWLRTGSPAEPPAEPAAPVVSAPTPTVKPPAPVVVAQAEPAKETPVEPVSEPPAAAVEAPPAPPQEAPPAAIPEPKLEEVPVKVPPVDPLAAAAARPKRAPAAPAVEQALVGEWAAALARAAGTAAPSANALTPVLQGLDRLFTQRGLNRAESDRLLARAGQVSPAAAREWLAALRMSVPTGPIVPGLSDELAVVFVILHQDALFPGGQFDAAASRAASDRVRVLPSSAVTMVTQTAQTATGQPTPLDTTLAVTTLVQYPPLFRPDGFDDAAWKRLYEALMAGREQQQRSRTQN